MVFELPKVWVNGKSWENMLYGLAVAIKRSWIIHLADEYMACLYVSGISGETMVSKKVATSLFLTHVY